jgi:hypothetical protein
MYLQALTNAENNTQSTINSSLGLARNELQKISCDRQPRQKGRRTYIIILPQQNTTLTVSHNSPINLGILELLHAQFTGKSAVGLVVDVLRRHGDRGVGEFAGKCEVDGRRGDDDLGGRVALGVVDVGDDGFDGVGDSVPAQCQ